MRPGLWRRRCPHARREAREDVDEHIAWAKEEGLEPGSVLAALGDYVPPQPDWSDVAAAMMNHWPMLWRRTYCERDEPLTAAH